MLKFIRKNIGIVFSFLGFFLLVVITFGNIVDVFTPQYWRNVYNNLASIGMLSVALVFIQTTIKQGISEQALSSGLNTENTKTKYNEHREAMKKCDDKVIYLPYFLDIRNLRETTRRKKDFLVNNRFTSEKNLFKCGSKKMIRQYNAISTCIRIKDIKWTSTEVVTDKNGRIETLSQFRGKRLIKGIVVGIFSMLFATLIARELFNGVDNTPLWSKFVKLFTYIITIAATVVSSVLKNYEKGAFGVPNDLDEINSIWHEFERWEVPQWVIDEVEKDQNTNLFSMEESEEAISEEIKEVASDEQGHAEREEDTDSGAALQEESAEVESI